MNFPRLHMSKDLQAVTLREHQRPNGEVILGEKAALVAAFMSGTYLTVEGHVFHLDYMDERPPELDTDVLSIVRVLVVAAHHFDNVGFLDLLPEQPTHAGLCSDCGGSRWSELLGTVCLMCAGLGWCLLPGERGEEYVLALTPHGRIEVIPKHQMDVDTPGLMSSGPDAHEALHGDLGERLPGGSSEPVN